jgi:hypothetical protein
VVDCQNALLPPDGVLIAALRVECAFDFNDGHPLAAPVLLENNMTAKDLRRNSGG